jgi:hypothetical protein
MIEMSSLCVVYEGVRKLQMFLEGQRTSGALSYATSLRDHDADGFEYFDGLYGADTDAALTAFSRNLSTWSVTTPALQWLVSEGALTAGDVAQVITAQGNYAARRAAGTHCGSATVPQPSGTDLGTVVILPPTPPDPGEDKTPPLVAADASWSTTTWVIIGVGAAALGVVAWKLYQSKYGKSASRPKLGGRSKPPKHLKDFSDLGALDDGDCGCGG